SLLGLCSACGATGLDWVGEAHLESMSQQRVTAVEASSMAAAVPGSIPAAAEQSASESRPRLSHTVTLGEIDVVAAPAAAEPAFAGQSVIVNNYNQVNVTPAFGYGSYGYSRAGQYGAGFSPGHVSPHRSESSTSGPLPGQNWPAVADHGPSFPYATLPASPWTPTR
ncbi:MAG TPA: hypothetical protein VGC79_34270, partial [Polyangiaceae bacterium]